MKTKIRLQLLFLALWSLSGSAHAQGTAISYQGRLNDGGLPATGFYDFTFHIFDAEVGGSDLAGPLGPLPYDAVPVTDGVFSVILDFGPGLFSGPARWLEITVRTNGVGEPSLLTPRTPLLPTPYAIFADKAGAVASGTLTADQLNTAGIPPVAGQFLSYDGGSFLWRDAGALTGDVWSRNGAGDAYYNAGNVGIGTDSPTAKLDVRGHLTFDAGASPGIFTGTDNVELNRYLYLLNSPTFPSASGFKAGGILVSDSYSYANPGKNDLIVRGKIGIGTPTPTTKLTVKTATGQVSVGNFYGLEHTDGMVRLATYVDGSSGQLGTRSSHPLSFFVEEGFPRMTINTAGNVGIGTIAPTSRLHLYDEGSVTHMIESGGFLNAWSQLRFKNAHGQWIMGTSRGFRNDELYFARLGGADPAFTVQPNGDAYVARNASVCSLTIRGGCDLAEPFPMKEQEIEKGEVVVIDKEHPGQLQRSTHAYDKRVAGIVSGANGINSGISLHQEGALEGGQNVALTGRVYVWADASNGEIEPGDLLTTSDTAGHAMKVTHHARSQGAVIGKAMSALKEGKGLVLVLVTLQ